MSTRSHVPLKKVKTINSFFFFTQFPLGVEGGAAGGEKLVEGEDYNQSDYEYDGMDDEEFHFSSSYVPNEALTKKKYCQSVKIFQRIFKTEKQFEQFQRTVQRVKKYVLRVAFQVFMDTIPPDTATSLPQELWEKIWKYTQNDYFRYAWFG